MSQITRVLVLFLFAVSINSCGRPESIHLENKDFPLSEFWAHKFPDSILHVALSSDLIVVSRIGQLSALDAKSGAVLWEKSIRSDLDSLPLFSGENLIVTDLSRIITLDRFGNEINSFDFDAPDQDAELLAVHSGYAFLRRIPAYTLEVYDLAREGIAWKVAIGRGRLNIGFIENKDTAVIASSTFIIAQDIANGQTLWRLDDNAQAMTLDNARVYYFPRVLVGEKGANVSAVGIAQGNLVWDANNTFYSGTTPNTMRVFNKILVLGTDHGLIAVDINAGKETWRSMTDEFVYAQPVLIDGTLYVRGAYTHSIFAISPNDGHQLGYLIVNQVGVPGLIHVESENLFAAGDMLVFTSQSTIFAYR
jgi:outer membrane protein assembly factor BamB